MWKFSREYVLLVARRWWVIGVGVIAAVIGIALNISRDVQVPVWLWVSLALVALSVAQFLVACEIKKGSAEERPGSLQDLIVALAGGEGEFALPPGLDEIEATVEIGGAKVRGSFRLRYTRPVEEETE
ncbi:MAG: hypothetical protein MUP14_07940 [Dehalococcoidia bacterium]|nr:hypothetical protein [Dehalococcoidia bacterium]